MADEVSEFSAKLIAAREKRGWTIYAACENSATLGRQTLTLLERGKTKPGKASVTTMMDIVDLYWPEIQVTDFISDPSFARYSIKRKSR